MVNDRSPQAVLRETAAHPRGDDLARLVHLVASSAAADRKPSFDDVDAAAKRLGIERGDAETSFGNVLRALEKNANEGTGAAGPTLLSALYAHAISLDFPKGPESETRVVTAMLWLGANTSIDALSALDAALGSKADALWEAIAVFLRRFDAGAASMLTRAEALVAAAGLRSSTSGTAKSEVEKLSSEVRDPLVRTFLKTVSKDGDSSAEATLTGTLVPAPRSPLALLLLGGTGLLALGHIGRLIGRWAFRYRTSAELRATATGIRVDTKTEMLGRVLRVAKLEIPVGGLLRASREVRFPRLPMYVGLASLAIGSYFGVSIFVEGARAASPELLGIGALLLGLGVAIDFVMSSVGVGAKGRCRVVFVPRSGPAFAMADVESERADAVLRRLLP